MPLFEFITVTRVLAREAYLAEAAGTFELSAIGSDPESANKILRAKLKEFYTDDTLADTLSLHRRRVGAALQTATIEVKLTAPARSRAWQEAVRLPVHFAWWQERDDMFVAYAPVFRVMVYAPRAEELRSRMEKNVRLVLARFRGMTLVDLSRAEAVSALETGSVSVEVTRKTPKQIALTEEREKDPTETLKKVAEPLGGAAEPFAFELEAELQALAEALRPESSRSVLLVGPAGCGKTSLVREFVRRRGEFMFGATTFWETSGSRLMTGPIGYGMWQERCQNMCAELSRTNGILHIGNLAELTQVGKTRRTEQSVGGFLRPWIARGEVQFIAEITPDQLSKVEQQEPQLVAAFQQVNIPARSREQTAKILGAIWARAEGERPTAQEEHATRFGIARLLALHERYGVYSARPGRAVRFLRNILSDVFPKKILSEHEVTARFSRESGMPVVLLDDNVPLELEQTERWFSDRVIGQSQAVRRVVDLIATAKARVARPGKPLASLLFIGPTGVGKTELAKALAEFFFGSTSRMTRFDLNQFNDPFSVQRLIGGTGAAGTNEGLLTARVREQPFSVILLDEFEKADAAFFDLLLQILGEGRLTDACGRVADFSNCVIVMTSNLGAEQFQRGSAGFKTSANSAADHFESAVAKFLRPEIFNRIDAIVPFHALPPEVIRSIADKYIAGIQHRHGIARRETQVQIGAEVVDHLTQLGQDPKYGARPLKRAIERELLVPLAEELAEAGASRGVQVNARLRNGRIDVFSKQTIQRAGERDAEETARATIAAEAVELRRAVTRTKKSPAFVMLENQITLLSDLDKRLKKATWQSPQDLERVARLPVLKRVEEDISRLESGSVQLETEVLGSFYQKQSRRETASFSALTEIRAQRRELQVRLFEASQEKSNEVILAVYSESKPLLIQFLSLYKALAEPGGKTVDLRILLPAPRGKGTKTTSAYHREKIADVKKFFAAPPPNLLGAIIKVEGALFLPKFATEAGLHKMIEEKTTSLVLIETATGTIDDYNPPQGFELQGFINAKSATLRRTYFDADKRVKDSVLGERPWVGPGLERCVASILEEYLTQRILAATGGA